MPKVILGRWKARLVHDHGEYAFCEWSFDDGLFSIYYTEHASHTNKLLVAVCKQVCFVPSIMRAVLETRLGAAGAAEWMHKDHLSDTVKA